MVRNPGYKFKSKSKSKIKPHKIDLNNWNTTDEDEVERRKIRAGAEGLKLENLGLDKYFSNFYVYNNSDKKYYVEIRSLNEHINSCDCKDYRSNELGTCKHIEFVLSQLQKKGVRKYREFAAEGSARIEIYLNVLKDFAVSVKWPKILPNHASELLESFFSTDGTLLGENIVKAYEKLAALIQANNDKIFEDIRVSKHIAYFMHYKHINEQKEFARTIFLQDVDAGKRTLNPVKARLLPYQVDGMLHLAFTERALLADEMGLGKTIQAIAACELLKQVKHIQRVLVVTTASLKSEWEEQIAKFSDSASLIIYGSRAIRLRQYRNHVFYYLMNYEQVVSDYAEIQKHLVPDVVILDEAQRIKNWHTKTAIKIKELSSRYAFVLTGTPVENKIDDMYSLIQFLDPHLFGPLFRFNRSFYTLDDKGKPNGYKNLNQMYYKLRPVMLARRKVDVEEELPKRTDKNYYVAMDKEQRIRYEEQEAQVAKILARAKKRNLTKEETDKLQRHLACMRMICDTPYILDEKCKISPKVNELGLILEDIFADGTSKVIIFSEWERMLMLVGEMLNGSGIDVAWHTGSIDQKKRRTNINRFKTDPNCRIFLSTDAGSVGLNLQIANVVINLDLPWNPAKLEQRIARAWRKNQMRMVQVVNLVCDKSIEHRMLSLLEQKRTMAMAVMTDSPDISELKMPSGRAALIERLENLMDINTDSQDMLDKDNKIVVGLPEDATNMKNTILNEVSGDLDLLTYTVVNNNPAMLAVSKNPNLKEIEKKVKSVLPGNNVSLEMIDATTFATIKRLAEAGILTLNIPDSAVIYDKVNEAVSAPRVSPEQIQKANSHLEQARRKHRMANVLIQGEFVDEAILPLQESFMHTFNAFCHFMDKTAISNDELGIEDMKKVFEQYNAPCEIAELLPEVMHGKNYDMRKLYNDQHYAIESIIKLRDELL